MATPYSEVYDFFLSKVTEYSFLTMSQAELETQLKKYLRSAVVDFIKPKVALTKDDALDQFTNTLNDDEKEVLATWMLYHFIKPKVVSSESFRQLMSDSDFKIYSQANHLQALIMLMKEVKREAEMLNTKYSYKDRDLRKITDESENKNNLADGVIPPYDWYLYGN